MANALPGVRVGPLDPDRGENFGMVAGGPTARQLVRHHMAQHPPQLLAQIGRVRQAERSDALDREEVEKAAKKFYKDAGEDLPDGTTISGLAVRGEDDKPDQQCVSFVFTLESGRTGKGAIPYADLKKSVKAGDEAVRIAKLKEAGLPWQASATAQAEDSAGEDIRRRLADAEKRAEEAEEKLREHEEQRPPISERGGQAHDAAAATTGDVDTGAAGEAANGDAEPYEGYDSENAKDIAKYVREQDDQQIAERVLAYEGKNANRKSVVSAANSVLNRKPAS